MNSCSECDREAKCRGMCQVHYSRWYRESIRRNAFEGQRRRATPLPIYENDDGSKWRKCADCRKDFPVEAFSKLTSRVTGISAYCKMCALERGNKNRTNEYERMRAKGRQAKRRALTRNGNAKYAKWLKSKDSTMIPSSVVSEWTKEILEFESIESLAERTGISYKTISRIKHNEYGKTLIVTAEKIASAAGKEEELRQYEKPHGFEGWNSLGDRFCRRCGTCWHHHCGLGLCNACYIADKSERETGKGWLTTRERMMQLTPQSASEPASLHSCQ